MNKLAIGRIPIMGRSALGTLGNWFDSHRLLQKTAKVMLIRLPLLAGYAFDVGLWTRSFAPILRPRSQSSKPDSNDPSLNCRQ